MALTGFAGAVATFLTFAAWAGNDVTGPDTGNGFSFSRNFAGTSVKA